jgi:hypothetical protein
MSDKLDIEGFFCINDKSDEDESSIFLNQSLFKKSVRRFSIEDLVITESTRFVGTIFMFEEVYGVVNVKGSLIPFYIDEKKLKRLQLILEKNNTVIKL